MKKKPVFFSLASRSHNVKALKEFLERYMRHDGFAPLQREVNGEKVFFVEKTRNYTVVSCLGIWVGIREATKFTYPVFSKFVTEVTYGDTPAPFIHEWKLSKQGGRDMHSGIFTEAICRHGVGHHKGVHGCDGCCKNVPENIWKEVSKD